MASNKSPKKAKSMSALELAMMEAVDAIAQTESPGSQDLDVELEVTIESSGGALDNASHAIQTAMNVFADTVATDDLPILTVEGTEVPPSSVSAPPEAVIPIIHLDDQLLDQMIEELDRGAAPPEPSQSASVFHAESLKVELDRTRTRLESLTNDFNRFKKRTEKQQSTARENIIADIVGRLLPLIDNLDRAILDETTVPEETIAVLQEGVSMMTRQFRQILVSLDVGEIETTDTPFDPSKHDAMEVVFDPSVEDGVVLECIQKGYSLPTRLIRPAKVRVATRTESTPKPATNEHIANQLKNMQGVEEQVSGEELPPTVPGGATLPNEPETPKEPSDDLSSD